MNIKSLFLITVTALLFAGGCAQQIGSDHSSRDNESELESLAKVVESKPFFCPDESQADGKSRLCLKGDKAIGPFTKKMVQLCKDAKGGDTCSSSLWDAKFALQLRLKGECMRGAEFDDVIDACVEEDYAYGPFSQKQVDYCKNKSSKKEECETMRIAKKSLAGSGDGVQKTPSILNYVASSFLKLVSDVSGYSAIKSAMQSWFGYGGESCAAFMSTLLRTGGTAVPHLTITLDLSRYLEKKLGWKRISNPRDLKMGDVVFTLDHPSYPGYPAHVYLFMNWTNGNKSHASIIDNQGFMHTRNIVDWSSPGKTPFKYALRAPGN